jgi:transcription initiation factor TFIIIB Brf1 subunit/transcription initiation factor TFIIB
MNLTADCPKCGSKITIKDGCYQGWLFCSSCQCIFFSQESLRKNWPSLYKALKKKKVVFKGVPVN